MSSELGALPTRLADLTRSRPHGKPKLSSGFEEKEQPLKRRHTHKIVEQSNVKVSSSRHGHAGSRASGKKRGLLTLPDELLVMIFSYFDSRDILFWDLFLVNTRFLRLLFSYRKDIDLSNYKFLSSTLFNSILVAPVRLTRLRKLNVSDCKFLTDEGLKIVANLGGLTYLDARRCKNITDLGFENFDRLRKLKWLNLSENTQLTDRALMNGISCLKSLTSLDLSCCENITNAGCAKLNSLKKLRSLSLYKCDITDALLPELRNLTNLTDLDIGGIICQGAELTTIQQLPNLRALNFKHSNNLTNSDLRQISKLEKLTSLVLLNSPQVGGHSFEAYLSPLTNLKMLVLQKCPRLDDDLTGFLSRLQNLETLAVGHNLTINILTFEHIGRLNMLKTLSCYKMPLLSDDCIHELVHLNDLETISLSGCESLTNISLELISDLESLTALYISNTNFTNIKCLARAKHLRELHIESCQKVSNWDKLSELKSLQVLHIGANSWCSDMTRGIPRHIKHLNLREVRFKKHDLDFLSEIIELECLSLAYCLRLKSKSLEPLKNLKKLKELELQHCARLDADMFAHLETLSELKQINIVGCDKLSPRRLLEHLKQQGHPTVVQIHF